MPPDAVVRDSLVCCASNHKIEDNASICRGISAPGGAKIKIAFIDSWLQASAQGSGTAVGIGGLQRALTQLGHSVVRLAPESSWPRDLTLRRLWFNVQLPRLLRAADYDLIVGFDIDGCRYAAGSHLCPYIVSVKGVLAEEARQETGKWRWLLGALSLLEGYNARHADLVLTTSRYCQDAIERHYGVSGEKIRRVPEGIDVQRWQRLVREVPRQSDGATILCVARHYRRKRIGDLLHALTIVRQTVPQVRAILVGAGPEHWRWRRLRKQLGLQDRVQMLGEVPDDDMVAQLYRRADIFCLPTIQEGFGIVFLEAMASGLPVVSTTATAIPEVVPQAKAGILVPPKDVPALAHALLRLLRDEELRRQYGAHGQLHVQQFDWLCVAEQFLAVIRSVLCRR